MKIVVTVNIIHSKDEIGKAASNYSFDENVKGAFKAGVDWTLKKLEEDNL